MLRPRRKPRAPRAPLDVGRSEAQVLDEIAEQMFAELPQDEDMALLRRFLSEAKDGRKALNDLIRYKHVPVGIREFIESPDFMNVGGEKPLWPAVIDTLEVINSGKFTECVLTGGIGVAKTTIALYTIAYQLYLLSCYRDPHKELDQDSAAEIVMVIQSITAGTAQRVDYTRLRNMIERSPYFASHFPFREDIESEMRFPNNIYIRPISGQETGAIGENVIGGIIDEINFMAVIEKSSKAIDQGVYDQAVQNYNSIAKRRQSRFLMKGSMPGMLCLVSSRKYPGQFTDKKEEEARTNKSIYVYDKRLWELRPERFDLTPDRMFTLFKGDATRKAYIIESVDQLENLSEDDLALTMAIPDVYLDDFRKDMIGSLRDIAGVAAVAVHPFIMDPLCLADAFGRKLHALSRPDADFKATFPKLYPKVFKQREEPRWAHIDLAETGDSAGLAIGYCSGFTHLDRGSGVIETLPQITFDVLLEIKPPKGGEIIFDSIRKVLYAVRKVVPVKWVSLDSYQSTDMIQTLAAQGFMSGKQSMDKELRPYAFLKQAFYDRRVIAPEHLKAQSELNALEYDTKKQKVDHPPHNSKDVADCMAGVIFGLTMRREVWIRHQVPLTRMPAIVKETSEKAQREEELKGKSYMERVKALRRMELEETR